MQSQQQQLISQLTLWLAEGQPVWLCTVVETFGSSPRPAGSMMACVSSGAMVGSLSGGCIEEDLLERLAAGEFEHQFPLMQPYGVDREQAERLGLPCGGSMQICIEQLLPDAKNVARYQALQASIEQRQPMQRRLCRETGQVQLETAEAYQRLVVTVTTLTKTFAPQYRLVIVGAGQIASYLAEMANSVGFEVIITDPRATMLSDWSVAEARMIQGMPDEVVSEWAVDGCSAIVTLTHDPRIDDMALMEALKTPAFYVGALGSKKTTAVRKERLKQLELSEAEIARLDAPIGLPIGSKTPPEIAVSIIAKLIEQRR